jgi:hypothetical protein
MPKSKPPVQRARHDTRAWILKAFDTAAKPEGLLTSEIKESVNRLSGTRIPDFSVYSALRTMMKRKVVTARRRGRQFQFKLTGPSARSPPAPRATPAPEAAPAKAAPAPPASTSPIAPSAAELPSPTLHKLAPGEAVILHIGERHIETATNVHGKVVLERHRRPVR